MVASLVEVATKWPCGRLDEKRELREFSERIEDRLDATTTTRRDAYQTLRGEIAETQALLEQARLQAHQDELALVTAERDLGAAISAIGVVDKGSQRSRTKATSSCVGSTKDASNGRTQKIFSTVSARRLFSASQERSKLHKSKSRRIARKRMARRARATEAKIWLAGVSEKAHVRARNDRAA